MNEPVPTSADKLMVVEQLPIISEELRSVKAAIDQRLSAATGLVATEENLRNVKALRAMLKKEFTNLENQRKAVKAAIMEPYDAFNATYEECVGAAYKNADKVLGSKIAAIEGERKQQKLNELMTYFGEYRESLGLSREIAPYEAAGINITLTASMKSLREQAKAWLDKTAADVQFINETCDDAAEVLAEYAKCHSVRDAIKIVSDRHAAVEAAERQRQNAAVAAAARQVAAETVAAIIAAETAEGTPLSAPTYAATAPKEPAPEKPQIFEEFTFTVYGCTREQLIEIRDYLKERGIQYK